MSKKNLSFPIIFSFVLFMRTDYYYFGHNEHSVNVMRSTGNSNTDLILWKSVSCICCLCASRTRESDSWHHKKMNKRKREVIIEDRGTSFSWTLCCIICGMWRCAVRVSVVLYIHSSIIMLRWWNSRIVLISNLNLFLLLSLMFFFLIQFTIWFLYPFQSTNKFLLLWQNLKISFHLRCIFLFRLGCS